MRTSVLLRHPWRWRKNLTFRLKGLVKRPVCWAKGHRIALLKTAVFVAEDAIKPAGSYCTRCGQLAPRRGEFELGALL